LAEEQEYWSSVKKNLLEKNPLALCTLEEINEIWDKENPELAVADA
jgi:hypothetical protein